MTGHTEPVGAGRARLAHLTKHEVHVLAEIRDALGKVLTAHSFRLILFGSKARGDYDNDSDLDLAIVVDGLDRTMKRAILDAIADIEIEHFTPVSALILSEMEFDRLLNRERRIALDIEHEGIML